METSEKNSIFGEIYLFRDFLRQSLLPALFIPAPRSPLPAPGSRTSHIPHYGFLLPLHNLYTIGTTYHIDLVEEAIHFLAYNYEFQI
jgi:hypothetical protein